MTCFSVIAPLVLAEPLTGREPACAGPSMLLGGPPWSKQIFSALLTPKHDLLQAAGWSLGQEVNPRRGSDGQQDLVVILGKDPGLTT